MSSTRDDPVMIDSLERVEDMDTHLAYAFRERGKKEFEEDDLIFLPKRLCELYGDDVEIPEWLAIERGLV